MQNKNNESIGLDQLNAARAELAQTNDAKKHFERAKGKGVNAVALALFLDAGIAITGDVSPAAIIACGGLTVIAGAFCYASARNARQMEQHAEKLRSYIDRYSLSPR